MVNFAIALLLGFLAGMGVGGGSLLLIWLTQVVMMPQPQARILNLLFYLPAAAASIACKPRKQLPRKVIASGIIAGSIAAALCTIIGRGLETESLKKMLGILLVITGLREIFYRPRNAR